MCSWYSTAREVSGISGIYSWSKLCAQLTEQRWEKMCCLVKNIPQESLCRWSMSPGLLPQLGTFTMWSVRLHPPATLSHGGKSCLWCSQATFTLLSKGELSHVLPRSLCPHTPAQRELLCSRLGLVRLAMAAECLFFPFSFFCLFLIFWDRKAVLYPPLQFRHSSHLSWLSKFTLRMTFSGWHLVPKVILHSSGFIQLALSLKGNLSCFSNVFSYLLLLAMLILHCNCS